MSLENIVIYILVGLVAGFLASKLVLGKGGGWVFDIIIGVLGAFLGGWLAGELHLSPNLGADILNKLVIAFAGAVILLLIWRLIFRRK